MNKNYQNKRKQNYNHILNRKNFFLIKRNLKIKSNKSKAKKWILLLNNNNSAKRLKKKKKKECKQNDYFKKH